MSRLRLFEKAADIDALELAVEPFQPHADAEGVLVEVHSAGVNMSDVKAALGAMPHAVWPRTPGRDWAGIVRKGPDELIGKEVWGTGGDLGITRDGSHSRYLVLSRAAVQLKPTTISLLEAGSLGVPFVTAYAGFHRAGLPQHGDVVLVLGATGKVGQAAIQIASMLGARIFGVERKRENYIGHASSPVRMIDASCEDIAEVIRDETGGQGADIVFNTVGSPYFDVASKAMAVAGRQVFIATINRLVTFDIFAFYRARHAYFGVDSLALDAVASARILEHLTPGFEARALRPFPVVDTYPLEHAKEAYRAVHAGYRERVVLTI
jgi:NADPH:quinone reductase